MTDIDNIIKNSTKAELLEKLAEYLVEYDKAIVVLVKDKDGAGFETQTLLMGVRSDYEACGIIEVAKHDLLEG